MAKSRRVSSRGALLVVDLARVDAMWSAMPARDAIALVTKPLPPPAPPIPGTPSAFDARGLDVALASLTSKKMLDRPLADGLKAKRALGVPLRWFAHVPDAREETRADERLLRWAEATRLPDLDAADVLLVTSAAERALVGASEFRDAFARWSTPAFASALEALPSSAVQEALVEAWDAPEPLLPLVGVDAEDELWAFARRRIDEVREILAFAKARGLSLVPWNPESFGDLLAARAAARAR